MNFGEDAQRVDLEILGLQNSPDSMTVTLLNSTHALDENSFDDPFKACLPATLLAACNCNCDTNCFLKVQTRATAAESINHVCCIASAFMKGLHPELSAA